MNNPIIGEIGETPNGFEWRIGEFLSLSGIFYRCPSFTYSGRSWHLRIYPNTRDGHIVMCLVRESEGFDISVEFSLMIKSMTSDNSVEKRCTKVFRGKDDIHFFDRFLSRSELKRRKAELVPAGVLTVVCHLETPLSSGSAKCSYCGESMDAENIPSHEKKCLERPIKCPDCSEIALLQNWNDHKCPDIKKEVKESASESANYHRESKVLQDFKELFLKQKNCDIVVKVKEREFPAHRAILTARSTVFESTFRSDMKEKATGIIDIEDCDPETFSDFLCFLYCGDADIINKENVLDLFTAADKYNVQDLMNNCMKFIKENLSVDTFCETIILALQFSEKELMQLATDFFCKNLQEIIVTVKWQSFLADYPTQSNELFVKALVSNKNSNT